MMKSNKSYLQPDGDTFQGRELVGILEHVDYSQNSNLRIWYNTQKEGYAAHQHSATEIIIPVKEPYTVMIDKQTYRLEPGDILFIPRFAIHELLPQDCGSRFIYMFNMEPLGSFRDSSSLEPVLMEPHLMNRDSHPGIYEHIYSDFMQMNDIYFSNIIFWEYSIYAILIDLLTTMGRDYYQSAQDPFHEKYYQKFSGLLSYIDAYYAEDLTLEMMASYMGFSKYHFARLFKEHTNSTFYDYLSRKRVQAAKTLLASDRSITDIAFQTGFNSSASFARCFKKYTKYSPSEYRDRFITGQPDLLALN